eukprot:6174352-Pleurochrysis_carterae.AAC.2
MSEPAPKSLPESAFEFASESMFEAVSDDVLKSRAVPEAAIVAAALSSALSRRRASVCSLRCGQAFITICCVTSKGQQLPGSFRAFAIPLVLFVPVPHSQPQRMLLAMHFTTHRFVRSLARSAITTSSSAVSR